eukprot:6190636-Pleurochrysis_carterae.AAC.2
MQTFVRRNQIRTGTCTVDRTSEKESCDGARRGHAWIFTDKDVQQEGHLRWVGGLLEANNRRADHEVREDASVHWYNAEKKPRRRASLIAPSMASPRARATWMLCVGGRRAHTPSDESWLFQPARRRGLQCTQVSKNFVKAGT